MKILFLHGWQSVPGGVKPTYLAQHGHTGTWTTPCIGENAITDHSGAFADLYLPKLP
jgi:hypothetical protein